MHSTLFGTNLFYKVSSECLALVGGLIEKFLCEVQVGHLEAAVVILRNFEQCAVKVLIRVVDHH